MKKKFLLRTQLIVTYTALLMLVIGFISVYVYKSMFGVVIKNTEDAALNNLKHIETNIQRFQTEMESVLYSIYLNNDVKDFVTDDYDAGMTLERVVLRKKIMEYLNSITVVNSQIKSIFIISPLGETIGLQNDFTYSNCNESEYDIKEEKSPEWKIENQNLYQSSSKQLNDQNYVSVSKAFAIKADHKPARVILIIDTEQFCRLFENYLHNKNSLLYLYYNGFRILNDEIVNDIKNMQFFKELSQEKMGSFIYNSEKDLQIVFNHLKNPEWIIIEEIPYHQYTEQVQVIKRNITLIFLLSIIISILLSILFIQKITVPVATMAKALEKAKSGELGYQIEEKYNNEFDTLITYFNSMSTSVKSLMIENSKIEKQKMNYAMNMLRSQINPHFMFNTLNMIKWMAISQNCTNISECLEKLMVMLRPVFKENNNYCRLIEEIEYVTNYIQLINLRFAGRIVLKVDIDETIMQQTVLRFILLPFIENCVKYGQGDDRDLEIKISAVKDDNLIITISDNGTGIDEQTLTTIRSKLADWESNEIKNGDKIGIANVNMRIYITYGIKHGITVDSSEGKGTTVTIIIPKI